MNVMYVKNPRKRYPSWVEEHDGMWIACGSY